MTQIAQQERRIGSSLQLGGHTTDPAAITTTGQSKIQLKQHQHQLGECRLVLGNTAAQLSQHLALFIADSSLQIHQPVADAQHGAGLDEQRASRSRAVMNLSRDLADCTRLHRQHRPAMAFGDHVVLQDGSQTAEHLLKLVSTLLTQPLPLLAQSGERGAGPVGNPTAFFEGKLQPLLQLGQRHHPVDQSGADRTQIGLIDLPPQATRRREGLSHPQQLLARGDTPFAAAQQHRAQIHHTAKTQSTLGEVIQHHHLHGFSEAQAARGEVGRKLQTPGGITPHARAGEIAEVLAHQRPLKELECFLPGLVFQAPFGCRFSCSWKECHLGVHKASPASCLLDLSDKTKRCRRDDHGRLQHGHRRPSTGREPHPLLRDF